ncbi:toxin-antitoxin system YwqK family antitoxin [Pedobacter panaciterrae]|uniref:toxin-antitoxin system YwqK family antitoxin n=1 Tax=Pedobacter panaciterrae TaxID=363849 RepID=UPI002598E256|nr:hypothetical protein [uncultured Pedobacter sp.]
MLKHSFLIFVLILVSLTGHSQIKRYYVNSSNEIVSDSAKAKFYMKVGYDQSDSTWKMHQYTMRDTLMVIGSFKDEELEVPHGKFTIFKVTEPLPMTHYDAATRRIVSDTEPAKYYVSTTGYFINGKKDGEWSDYYISGNLQFVNNWKDGQLTGRYRSYGYDSQKILVEGNYVNGCKEGVWTTFASSGIVLTKDFYKKNHLLTSVNYPYKVPAEERIVPARADYNFNAYLLKVIRNLDFGGMSLKIHVGVDVSKEGKLIVKSFRSNSKIKDESMLVVLNGIANAPVWKPANNNKGVVEEYLPISISFPSRSIEVGFNGVVKDIYENRLKSME